jgi:hypothetical protein
MAIFICVPREVKRISSSPNWIAAMRLPTLCPGRYLAGLFLSGVLLGGSLGAQTESDAKAGPNEATSVAGDPATGESALTGTASTAPPPLDAGLQQLAAEFFAWRADQQPASGDDIPRVERPQGWLPAWSAENLAIYRVKYRDFLERLGALDRSGFSRADEVDALLLASAIKRVGWELDVLRSPHRNPLFYIDQTLGSVFELLVLSAPVNLERIDTIVARLNHFPVIVAQARDNLGEAVQPFAVAAVDTLTGIEERLEQMRQGLEPFAAEAQRTALAAATATAAEALADYRDWLQHNLATMPAKFAIGPNAYQWYLAQVALIPHTPGELLAQGQQAWHRAVAWDLLERQRNRDLPELPLFDSAEAQIRASFQHEREIRAFLEQRDLMTVPDWLMHYLNRPLPAYLAPLAFMGVTDDLTSASRLDEDAVSYIREPGPALPYFSLASARDPRPLIAHEGVPGHYFQLALSWANPDPIRRRFFDSGANEGIGFYAEELLLQSGLFDFSPRSKEIIYSFMRLRALRVEVDIRLATGEFSIAEAGDYLARTVPMDRETAAQEAVFFAFYPGQAIGYQIGKLQILEFLSDARLDRGEDFSLRHFHDSLMRNGNVPIALQRWEYLGRDDGIRRLEELGHRPATVPQ